MIAISQCLLGDRVRYDAELKHFPRLIDFVQQHFQCVPVCPEVEIGLSVPRPPVQLVEINQQIQMLGRDDESLNITQQMMNYCNKRAPELQSIHGYLFKSRSPSCGVTDTPLFNPSGDLLATGNGLFTRAILKQYPKLPITDEQGVETELQQQQFLQQVLHYRKERSNTSCA